MNRQRIDWIDIAKGITIILVKSSIFQEPFKITRLFKVTFSKEMILLLTTLASNVLVYLRCYYNTC